MPEAICNTSPLQYLHQTGLLHLLAKFYACTLIPAAVARELDRGREIGVDLPDVRGLPWITVLAPETLPDAPATAHLGAGEKEVLALALEFPAATVILDERLARRHASTLGIAFTGTLGILLRGKSEGAIERIVDVVERLDSLGFRLSPKTRAAILHLAGGA